MRKETAYLRVQNQERVRHLLTPLRMDQAAQMAAKSSVALRGSGNNGQVGELIVSQLADLVGDSVTF